MIVNSIDVTQSIRKKQKLPLNHSFKTSPENKKHPDAREDFLEELGVSGEQFKTFFDFLPQGIALYKMIYNSKGVPVDFILLESNKLYDRLGNFQRSDYHGNSTTNFKLKTKDSNIDCIQVCRRVATSCKPE
jgi:hypothetical protein